MLIHLAHPEHAAALGQIPGQLSEQSVAALDNARRTASYDSEPTRRT